jgi:hypothetical protein
MQIKLRPNSKVPAGDSWELGDEEQARQWINQGFNTGTMMKESGLVVADFDAKESGRQFYRKYKSLCSVICETRRGVHFYFSGESQTRGIYENDQKVGDVKASGYCVSVPSVVDGFHYRWIAQGILQPFPDELFPILQRTRNDLRQSIGEDDPVRRLIRAHAWMKQREGKEDGSGRGLQMIKTCRALFEKFGLTEDQVWGLILEYNERCIPPYSEALLRHKIEDSKKGMK